MAKLLTPYNDTVLVKIPSFYPKFPNSPYDVPLGNKITNHEKTEKSQNHYSIPAAFLPKAR